VGKSTKYEILYSKFELFDGYGTVGFFCSCNRAEEGASGPRPLFSFSFGLCPTSAREGKLNHCHMCGGNSQGGDAKNERGCALSATDLSQYPIALLA